jgi:hypothetical protein
MLVLEREEGRRGEERRGEEKDFRISYGGAVRFHEPLLNNANARQGAWTAATVMFRNRQL